MMGITMRVAVALWLGLLTLTAPGAGNTLGGHPSPYLALHAADPVHWQDWGPEVLARARREGKLVLVSSGYFACHWCHVMQRESFRDAEVAAYLNLHFVPVKVDRELLPALDAHLIRFVARTGGRAGWPLNVFLTPAGHPLVGAGYLPRREFLDRLQRLQARWTAERDSLAALAESGARALEAGPAPAPPLGSAGAVAHADGLVRAALAAGDDLAGGFGHESKFPSSPPLRALLALQRRGAHPELAAFLALTLEQMARGGLRDHVGGGFFRYTVDPDWSTPHFEKMLYDNAQLATVYREAAEVLAEPGYLPVARETLDFLLDGMADAAGGFVASLSAVDASGAEGGYYLWGDDALRGVLSEEELAAVRPSWGLDRPPLEGGYLPVPVRGAAEVAARLGLSVPRVQALIGSARTRLLEERGRRALPRDGKVIAAWNGLALEALAGVLHLPGAERYRRAGEGLRVALTSRLRSDGAMRRALAQGRAVGEGALEDYAHAAAGLLAWGEATADATAIESAAQITQAAWARFRGASGWRLAGAETLPFGGEEALIPDGALPSPSAVLLGASLRLAELGGPSEPARRAREVLARDYPALTETPLLHATHIALLAEHAAGEEGARVGGAAD
jgi:hypothetical protein